MIYDDRRTETQACRQECWKTEVAKLIGAISRLSKTRLKLISVIIQNYTYTSESGYSRFSKIPLRPDYICSVTMFDEFVQRYAQYKLGHKKNKNPFSPINNGVTLFNSNVVDGESNNVCHSNYFECLH